MRGAPVTKTCLWHFAGLTPVCPQLCHMGESSTGHLTPQMFLSMTEKGRITSLGPAGAALTNAAQGAVGLLCCKVTLLAYVQLDVYQDCLDFSAVLLPSQSALHLYWCMWLFIPRCSSWHFLLLTYMRIPLAHLSTCQGLAEWLYTHATPLRFVSPANLLRVLSVPTFKSPLQRLSYLDLGLWS